MRLMVAVALFCAGCGSKPVEPIKYVFHFHLTNDEMEKLPVGISKLADSIERKDLSALSDAERQGLISTCPYREQMQNGQRLLWRLDGEKPGEGDRCIVIDLDSDSKIIRCGLVILG